MNAALVWTLGVMAFCWLVAHEARQHRRLQERGVFWQRVRERDRADLRRRGRDARIKRYEHELGM